MFVILKTLKEILVQQVVALSFCEVEYIAAYMVACQAQWINKLLVELQLKKNEKMELMVDRKYSIYLAKHPIDHGRSKHIETCFQFVRDQVNKCKLVIKYYKTEEQVDDLLTKPLKISSFEHLKSKL